MEKWDLCPTCGARIVLGGRPTRRGKKHQKYVCTGSPVHSFVPIDD